MSFIKKIKKILKLSDNEYGEQITDSALDGAATVAESVAGEEHADKIQSGREFIDGKIGQKDAE